MTTPEETTFRNFTSQQALEYNASRGNAYPAKLYENIVAYHKENGGQTQLALDLGCGPGNATRDLAEYFDHVVGLDGSPEMINAAQDLLPKNLADRLRFSNVSAERLDEVPGIDVGTVDVITVATAVHWFDLPSFYASAMKVLRPGGTIAVWSPGRPKLKGHTMHTSEIDAVMEKFYQELAPYRQERSSVAQDMYARLPLPWTLTPSIEGFDESSFKRTVFSDENGNQLSPAKQYSISQAERMYGSGSPIVRWRQAHPDLVGTDQDIVKVCFNMIRKIIGKEEDVFDVDARFGLLLWRKSA